MASFPTTLKHHSGANAQLDATRIFLKLEDSATDADRQHILTLPGLALEENPDPADPRQVNQRPTAMWLRDPDREPIPDATLTELHRLLKKCVDWIGPVYQLGTVDGLAGAFTVPPAKLHFVPRGRLGTKTLADGAKVLKKVGVKDPGDLLALDVIERPHGLGEISGGYGLVHPDLLAEIGALGLDPRCTDSIPLLRPQAACDLPVPQPPLYWTEQVQPLENQLQVCSAWGLDVGGDKTTKGDPSVHICVIDTGFDLEHGEFDLDTYGPTPRELRLYHDPNLPPQALRGVYTGTDAYAINRDHPPGTGTADAHGTAVLGIAAGRWDSVGIAGVAGRCSIFALKAEDTSSAESIGRCLEQALDASGTHLPLGTKRVIVLPGTSDTWVGNATLAAALTAAAARDDVLIIGPTGNAGDVDIEFPTSEAVVMGVGAVDAADGRALNPGAGVFSQYNDDPVNLAANGPGLSVMAPGLFLTTSDLQAPSGQNATGDYMHQIFSGTSAAAAHVAGVAALLFSRYPNLTAAEVRDIIERTADKVGEEASVAYDYEETADVANPRHLKMGFGRVNALHALDLADVMIRDNDTDDGTEPSTGNKWSDADVVIRPDSADIDEATFLAYQDVYAESRTIARDQDNTIWVRVMNRGPAQARNVTVTASVVVPSTGFNYPSDWEADSSDHAVAVDDGGSPGGTLATLDAGATALLKLRLPQAEGDKLKTWTNGGHGCVLAKVTAENDYAFQQREITGGVVQMRSNNLVQRNVDLLPPGSPWRYPFTVGGVQDLDAELELVVDVGTLPNHSTVRLALDDPRGAFPELDFSREAVRRAHRSRSAEEAFRRGDELLREQPDSEGSRRKGLRFVEGGVVEASLGGFDARLKLGSDSLLARLVASRESQPFDGEAGEVELKGAGEVILQGRKRSIELRGPRCVIRMKKQPNQVIPLCLTATVPAHARSGDRFTVTVEQRRVTGETIGGITLLLHIP